MSDLSYTSSKFPKDNIDPALKAQPQYNLEFAKAAYSQHLRDQGGARGSKKRDIALLKLSRKEAGGVPNGGGGRDRASHLA